MRDINVLQLQLLQNIRTASSSIIKERVLKEKG